MKYASLTVEPEDDGGSSGQAKRWVNELLLVEDVGDGAEVTDTGLTD